MQEVSSSGSGFVLDSDGHILTNYHVVENATEIEVSFYDGWLAWAEVVGTDPDSDLAVIQVSDVPAEQLVPVTFGDSDALQVGETVLAIGSPFGERWTLTSGIISAVERTIRSQTDYSIGGAIQTDAAINPGNSGGPLINLNGEVIGVNSQILSSSGANSGIGFAIPGNLAQRVAQQLIEQGYVQYSYLGITGSNVSLRLLESLGLPNDTRGVAVFEVRAGSPAQRGGLQAAGLPEDASSRQMPETLDIITAINGTQLTSMEDLIGYLARNTSPGDTVTLSVLRNGNETLDLSVTLTPRP
jgi:S1-C subfamily serine protease